MEKHAIPGFPQPTGRETPKPSISPVFPRPMPPLSPAPNANRRRRRTLLAGALLGLTGLSVAGAVVVSTCTLCYAVSTDGAAPLAYVQGHDTYQAAVRQVETQVSEILRSNYDYPRQTTMALTIAPKERLQTSDQLTASLMETVELVKAEYILTVDGLPIGACESREVIDQALWEIKNSYTNQFTVAAYFGNTVDVIQGYLPVDTEVLDAPALVRRLTQPRSQAQAAIDALSQALERQEDEATGVLPEELQALPRGGSSLPLLTVRTVEEVTYTQPVEPEVQEVEDPTLLVGERKVLQEGTPGLAERTDRVTYALGQEESRENMSVNLLTPATPTQVAVGTAQGAEGAQGRFLWPLEGRITSAFGGREIFGSENFHRGIDIAAPQGTPIAASASGTVIWSGGKGTYGNLVKLDHGNGFVTYYAHCSQLLVQEGDQVAQGDTIALVGSTGRSTGPHCHFEILWQETLLDPQLCLP